jgi:light-harvesting complex 1 alpha chain
MYRMWLLFDPRRGLLALSAFLFVLALIIRFILPSTERFDWFEGKPSKTGQIELERLEFHEWSVHRRLLSVKRTSQSSVSSNIPESLAQARSSVPARVTMAVRLTTMRSP